MAKEQTPAQLRASLRRTPPRSDEELWRYIREFCHREIPRRPIKARRGCREHCPPFNYVADMIFDRVGDCMVWAARGAGKTHNAAILTAVESAFMPGLQTRILGGSEQQSKRTYEEFLRLADGEFAEFVQGEPGMERTRLRGGGMVEILAASATSVLGHHVPRLRLDEVDEFDAAILEQAIGTSMSDSVHGYRGRLEIYSTYHNPYGCMSQQLSRAKLSGIRVYQWCIFEVMEKCPPIRQCRRHEKNQCALWEDCLGIAKTECNGYVRVDDVIRWKKMQQPAGWDSFFLCKEPYRGKLFFADFDPLAGGKHVPATAIPYNPDLPLYRAFDWGTNGPTVCLWIQTNGEKAFVIDEFRVRGKAASDCAREVKEYHIRKGYGPVMRDFCDPTGTAFVLEFRKWGFHPVGHRGTGPSGRLNPRREGWEILRRKILTANHEINLFVSPVCATLIWELMRLHYPEAKAGQPPAEDCAKIDDHGPDALRYALMGLFPMRPWGFIQH